MPNAGLVERGDFLKAMEKTLDKVYTAGYDLGGEQYSQCFDVRTSNKRAEEVLEYIGPAEVEESNEGGMYQRVTIESGRSKSFLHVTYKAEIKITEEMVEDVMYSQIIDAAKQLGIAAKRTVEKKCALALANGFASERSHDAVSAYNTAHPVLSPAPGNPTTWSNLISDRFTSSAVKKLRTLMRKQINEKGEISPSKMDQLIVGPDLEWVAGELLESNMLYDTANNTKNIAGRGLKLIILDHLQEAGQYDDTMFIGRDSMIAQNIIYWRVKPQSKFLNEEASGDPIWRARMRFSVGIASPRGLAASRGDDSAL